MQSARGWSAAPCGRASRRSAQANGTGSPSSSATRHELVDGLHTDRGRRPPIHPTGQGTWGGHRRRKIYGRLNCPSALLAIARGGSVANRVFFADEVAAVTAGYRPWGICCPERYLAWKRRNCRDTGEPWTP